MNLEEFQEKVNSIAEIDGIGLNIYFVLRKVNENEEEELFLKRANIKEEVKTDLESSYINVLNKLGHDEDLTMVDISKADDRKNAIFKYDLDDSPGIFNFFNDVTDPDINIDLFKFANDDLKDLEGYFVMLGDFENNICFYRKQMPINLFKRGKIYLVKGDATQFDSINKEFLRIDTKIDVIKIDDSIFINNISILERHYEFKAIIEKEAEASLANIQSLDILSNIEVLTERITETAFSRKLSKISTTSPVFTLEKDHIMSFVKDHSKLGKAFKYSADESQIMLDTKKSQNMFLKLMNDDFLHSQLTNYDYVTPAKDQL